MSQSDDGLGGSTDETAHPTDNTTESTADFADSIDDATHLTNYTALSQGASAHPTEGAT